MTFAGFCNGKHDRFEGISTYWPCATVDTKYGVQQQRGTAVKEAA